MINCCLIAGASKRLFRLLWGKVETETDRISRSASQVEGKIKSNKGADLKGLSVTQWILSTRRKDKKEGYETFGEAQGLFVGSPTVFYFLYKYIRLRRTMKLFPS